MRPVRWVCERQIDEVTPTLRFDVIRWQQIGNFAHDKRFNGEVEFLVVLRLNGKRC